MDCLSCTKFLDCGNPKKASGFSCYKYKGYKDLSEAFQVKGLEKAKPAAKKPAAAKSPETIDSTAKPLNANANASNANAEASANADVDNEEKTTGIFENEYESAFNKHGAFRQDLKIDDRDIPQLPNFYEFCTSPKGLDKKLLGKQFAIYTKLFAEYCPDCSPKAYMMDDIHTKFPVDYDMDEVYNDFVLLECGECPSCKKLKTEFFKRPKGQPRLRNFSSLEMLVGQRAGKSMSISMVQSYLTHWYLKIPEPALAFGQMRGTPLTATMVALTWKNARELLMMPYLNDLEGVNQAPWFKAYHEMLDYNQEKTGDELYQIGKLTVNYYHRDLLVYALNPSKRTLRGATRVWAVIDELGWMHIDDDNTKKEHANGQQVWTAMDRSLLTIRDAAMKRHAKHHANLPNGMHFCIGSPSAKNDTLMNLVRSSMKIDSEVSLPIWAATWDMNPEYHREHPMIVEAYAKNAVDAERDYGANPPASDNPFIPNAEEFLPLYMPKRKNVLGNFKYVTVKRKSSTRRYARFTKLGTDGGPCVLALDAGESNNSFALCLGKIDEMGHPKIIGLLEIMPAKNEGLRLDFNGIFNHTIMPIIKNYNVARIYFDRWQSLKLGHDVEEATATDPKIGPTCTYQQYALKHAHNYSDFRYVLECMESRHSAPTLPRIEPDALNLANGDEDLSEYPRCFIGKPAAHLQFQIGTVSDTGKAIVKGSNYTDDLFRAFMLCMSYLCDETERELLSRIETRRTVGDSVRVPIMVGMGSRLPARNANPYRTGNVTSYIFNR